MEDYLVYTAADANEALKQVCNQPSFLYFTGNRGNYFNNNLVWIQA